MFSLDEILRNDAFRKRGKKVDCKIMTLLHSLNTGAQKYERMGGLNVKLGNCDWYMVL
jgi:hypothetical protein